MATKAFIIQSDCWINGEPIKAGTLIEFNVDVPEHANVHGQLSAAGRIREATDAEVKDIRAQQEPQGSAEPIKMTRQEKADAKADAAEAQAEDAAEAKGKGKR